MPQLLFYILIFLGSCFVFFILGDSIIKNLIKIGKVLGWKEFVIAFLAIALPAALPDLFVGILSALKKIPELSLGDVAGGNIVDLTLAVSLAILFGNRELELESRTVRYSSIFAVFCAILPLTLIFDGVLSKIDGVILLFCLIFYFVWLFSEKERFEKDYKEIEITFERKTTFILKNLAKVFFGTIILFFAAQGIINSAQFFSKYFNLPLILVGILIVGLGNALPETYLSIVAAKKNQGWIVLGNLMGSVVFCSTLVLGIVSLICPIKVSKLSHFEVARIFLILSSLFFFVFLRTKKKITEREAVFLLFVYIAFLITESLLK
jgi:cation:H+ antiporter